MKLTIDTEEKKIIIIGFVSKAELDELIFNHNLQDYLIGAEVPQMRIVPIEKPVVDGPLTWPPPYPYYPDVMYSTCNPT